jgi:hypothetical protein
MGYTKQLLYLSVILSGVVLTACNSGKGNDANDNKGTIITPTVHVDSVVNTQKVTMVICNIPFPSTIFDTLHYAHATFEGRLMNPTESVSLYSQSNSQAINLGVYGADLSYVISFEQFQQVGSYMKATKYLTDKAGIPMAFTQQVIERCQKNSNNKDSLSRIVFQSYTLIDKALKDDQRKAMEILVLAGGWVEGVYINTQGLSALTSPADRQGAYNALLAQKHYLDLLLNQMDLVSDNPYCQSISVSLHEIRGIFNGISDGTATSNETIENLTQKISELRTRIVKGGNA